MNSFKDSDLYNCRTDYAAIREGEFHNLLLGGCRHDDTPGGELIGSVFIGERQDGHVVGGIRASDAQFFTIYGIGEHGDIEAVSDAQSAHEALAIAGELARRHGLLVEVSHLL